MLIRDNKKKSESEELDIRIQEYLDKGGKITVIPLKVVESKKFYKPVRLTSGNAGQGFIND